MKQSIFCMERKVMIEKDRLSYIKEELNAIVGELGPRLNELSRIQDCLENLIRVSDGENPERV